MVFRWDDKLKLGIAEIDRQHREIVDLVGDLYGAVTQERGKEVLAPIVEKLIEKTVVHFHTEESYFDHFGYPDAEAHKKKHKTFTKTVADIRDAYSREEAIPLLPILDFFSGWLSSHIKNTDSKYGPFFNGKGLS
ncbi:MAG: bacteriohemerythrin [Rectinemataceae bacterium]